jgi:phosphoenolpyruvate synthase/pyruvate phosphate dikinase
LKNLLVFLPITHPLVKIIESKVLDILKVKGIKEAEMNDVLFEISAPIKKNTPVLENEDLLKIKESYINDKNFDLDTALLSHTNSYGFLGYREPFSNGYDKKFFEIKLKNQEKIDNEHHKIENIKFTKDEQKYIDLLKEFVYFRTYRTEKLYESLFYLEALWKNISKDFGLKNEKDIGWYTLKEIEDLFKLENKVPDVILKNRKIGHAIIIHENNLKIIFSDEMFDYKKKYYPEQKLNTNQILGVSACKGKITGIVKIVKTSKDQDKVINGDILVTAMTTPDFLPCMDKAAAFITDEGGITCHAAIIAREMGKPCIIGTKFATQVLKDGDLVEVDADNGIVMIIKNHERLNFEKIYTRDTTYIMQEIWAYGCSEGIENEFGWKNPYLPGIIHRMNQGSIEIWENLKATKWLEDMILEKNIKDPKFIDEILKKYKEKLSTIHKMWEEKVLTLEKLKKLIQLSKDAITYFIFYYYSAVDERTPKEIREKALEMRNKDEFFAENDIVIRDSVVDIYPNIKGYETSIFLNELDLIPDINVLKKKRNESFIIQGKEIFVGSLNDFIAKYPELNFNIEVLVNSNINEIKGDISQKGKVTGRVKILRRRDQINEVTEEDIIVSPMTTPDFLPAMQIAKAFVTDEGGITCHAGIIARELKKPCIIGTKIATQVLKDGDLIEVDADNGVVRIIK